MILWWLVASCLCRALAEVRRSFTTEDTEDAEDWRVDGGWWAFRPREKKGLLSRQGEGRTLRVLPPPFGRRAAGPRENRNFQYVYDSRMVSGLGDSA